MSSDSTKPLLKASVLAPSKLDASASSSSVFAAPKLKFGGLKESRLGKLSSSSSATSKEATSTSSPCFVPLSGASSSSSTKSASSSLPPKVAEAKTEAFVFGQNLTDRAENFAEKDEDVKSDDKEAKKADTVTAEAATLMTSTASASSSSSSSSAPAESKKTLSESAAEYCESRSSAKRKYEEVIPVTGEEDEKNVLQMNARLHVFDKANSGWLERGRGQLRLNDEDSGKKSRLVMRTAGSLRVVLNTTLYAGQTIERPTEKTIRLTGTDEEGVVKVYLIGGSVKDADALYAALIARRPEKESPQNGSGDTLADDTKKIKTDMSK